MICIKLIQILSFVEESQMTVGCMFSETPRSTVQRCQFRCILFFPSNSENFHRSCPICYFHFHFKGQNIKDLIHGAFELKITRNSVTQVIGLTLYVYDITSLFSWIKIRNFAEKERSSWRKVSHTIHNDVTVCHFINNHTSPALSFKENCQCDFTTFCCRMSWKIFLDALAQMCYNQWSK